MKPPEQLRLPFPPTLRQLLNSALFADALTEATMGHGFRRVEDLTPEERERSEWARQRQQRRQRHAVFVSTTGKSKEQIVRELVLQARKAGLLKETPRSRKIK